MKEPFLIIIGKDGNAMKIIGTVVRILFFILFLILLANGKSGLWLGLFGISLIIALIFGRVYCGYACPMTTIMIVADWISNKLKIQTESIPNWLSKGWSTPNFVHKNRVREALI